MLGRANDCSFRPATMRGRDLLRVAYRNRGPAGLGRQEFEALARELVARHVVDQHRNPVHREVAHHLREAQIVLGAGDAVAARIDARALAVEVGIVGRCIAEQDDEAPRARAASR